MDLDLDSSALLYALGALLGIAAIVYFGSQIVIALSPTVKAALLFLGFVAFLAVGLHLDVDLVTVISYLIAAAAYVVFVGYTVTKFRAGTGATFLTLALSSALFIGLGYLVRERGLRIDRRDLGAVLIAVSILGVALVGVDAIGAEPTYTMELRDSVNVTSGEQVRVGALVADNRFPLSRTMDVPDYHACIYTPDRRLSSHLGIDRYDPGRPSDLLRGGETRRMAATLYVPHELSGEDPREGPPPRVTLGVIPVEGAPSCPPASSVFSPKVVVVPGAEPPSNR